MVSGGRRTVLKQIRHGDPNAKLPPRKDGKDTRLDLWSALVIRAGEQLEQNKKEDAQ
jgi:hypothetical protein